MNKEEPIAGLTELWLVNKGYRPAVLQLRIAGMWRSVMGDVVANQTAAIRLDNRILYISVRSASLRSELFFKRQEIKKQINDLIGQEYIQTVVVH